jgi:hypothetical protein
MTRKIVATAVVLLAAAVAACGGATQTATGTAPSLVSPVASETDATGTLGLLKQGSGKGHGGDHSPTPTIGTTPDPNDQDAQDAGDSEDGHGHAKAMIQIEGFTTSIDGTCPELTIVINNITVTTVDTPEVTTDFQRADCSAIAEADGPVHLHIAAKMQEGVLVAAYVRMQGPKADDADEEEDTTPTTTTTPTTK